MRVRRHFVTGPFTPRAQRLSDAAYAKVLDHVVVACVDCLLLDRGEVLLGRRVREPQPDWWVIGGRMLPGESFAQVAARHCRRELKLTIAPQRFKFLAVTSLVFARRAQVPRNHGCHTVAITMTTELTAAERAALQPNDEYRALRWWRLADMAKNKKLHPAVRQLACDLAAARRRRAL